MNRARRIPTGIEVPRRPTYHAWAIALFGIVMILATAWWLSPSSDQLLPNPRGPETYALEWRVALPLGIGFGIMAGLMAVGGLLRLVSGGPALALRDGRVTVHTPTVCVTFPLVRVIRVAILPRKRLLREPFLIIYVAGWPRNFGLVPRRRIFIGGHEMASSVEQVANILAKARDPLPTISTDGKAEGPPRPRAGRTEVARRATD